MGHSEPLTTVYGKCLENDLEMDIIGVAPITQLRACVIKIEAFKGGYLMW